MAAKKTTVAIRAEQTVNNDGTITIRAVELVTEDRDIRAADAGKRLGLHPKTIHHLCELGEEFGGLKAWKMPNARENAPWRISLASVLSFKDRNSPASR